MLPTLNPDGYETSRVKCQDNRLGRTTANGLNLILNKDFPQQFELISTSGREPETTAAVQWIQNNPFIISGDFHSGYMEAVYPFDGYANNHRIIDQNITCYDRVLT